MSSTGWLVLALSLGLALALATVGAVAIYLAGIRVRRQAGYVAEVKAAAVTDPLTGLLNRRGFIQALERELARSRRYAHPFVLAYADVRGLKGVNDSEGHLAGDALLREAAQLLRESARADDVVGRLGGDEMGLLLVEQSFDGAEAVLGRIRSQVPERRRRLGLTRDWDLTIGIAVFPDDGDTASALIAAADRRLYEQRGILLMRRRFRRPSEARRSRAG
jgi:diguanylate cyclase (GGDEF)-like protein